MRFERMYILLQELTEYLDKLEDLIEINNKIQFHIDEIRWRISLIEEEIREAEEDRREAARRYIEDLDRCQRRGYLSYLILQEVKKNTGGRGV